ncbi:MAG: glycosyltransferase [Bacteroidetes bacterium]|nr:glycosyltransferase [Bacteroidota bacterium]
MRILHVSTALSWRGGEQQLTYLIESLRSMDIEQVVFCPLGSAIEQYCKDHDIAHYSFYRSNLKIFISYSLMSVCQTNKINVIHTHDSHSHTLAVLASVIYGNTVPVIVSKRTAFPVNNSFLSRYKYNYHLITKILCVSHKVKDEVSKIVYNTQKLETVYSGVEIKRFSHKIEPLMSLEALGTKLERPFIGNVSALSNEKDLFTFIDTAATYYTKGRKGTFFIVGEGMNRTKIQKYIHQKNLTEKVILTGFQKDIPSIMKQFDCFLFTSNAEGLGTSILDAMASKVPIIATPAGGIPELIIDKQTGLLASVKDFETMTISIIRILDDEKLRNHLIDEAFKHVRKFTKEKMAVQTVNEYYQAAYVVQPVLVH